MPQPSQCVVVINCDHGEVAWQTLKRPQGALQQACWTPQLAAGPVMTVTNTLLLPATAQPAPLNSTWYVNTRRYATVTGYARV